MENNKKSFAGVTFSGSVTFNGPMFDIHDNQHVHIHAARMTPEEEADPSDEEWEMKELKFFDMKKYGSAEKQQQLRSILRDVTKRIDVNNGRDWFCVYAADRYVGECLGTKYNYVEFFTDIETLLPGILKRVNELESGYKRYKAYSELLRREADNWFVFNGSLPPINEMVYKLAFGCTEDQFKKYRIIIKDLYKQMREI